MASVHTDTAATPVDLGLAQLRAANQPAGGVSLPAGFPARLDSKLAWVGSDFADADSYVYQLTEADVAELGRALEHFKGLKLDGEHVSRATFPLPQLGAKLVALSAEVHDGRGFCLVRGLRPADYSVPDLTLVYLGVQAYIADERGRQDSRGNMLVHIVADNTTKAKAEHHRHSNKSITFHTEETGDVVGWLTRSTPVAGGRCILASAYTVYNALAAHRPDLVRLLARADWPFAFPRFHSRAVVYYQEDGRLVTNFGRTPLLGTAAHPRPRRLPRVSAAQREALDAVEAVAVATQLEMATQPGDMHFINNLAVLHRREAFADGDKAHHAHAHTHDSSTAARRHLVRMRLRSSTRAWALPAALASDWEQAFAPEGPRVWHPEPAPDGYFPLRKYPN